mgnify:FL=1
MSEIITSTSNNKIKLVRQLQSRARYRNAESAFVAEGVRLLEEIVKVNWPMRFVLFDETLSERGIELLSSLENKGDIEIARIPPDLMSGISDTETPQGILAVLEKSPRRLPEKPNFVVIADQIRDPGNMGTLLRTAEATGVEAVLLAPKTVDAFSPKVIRAGMGAHFHLPIDERSWEDMQSYLAEIPVFLAAASEGTPLWEVNLAQPCALLIGGEAFGASPKGEKIATQLVTIPMRGKAESLNAAVAAGMMMAEVLRQRYQHLKD